MRVAMALVLGRLDFLYKIRSLSIIDKSLIKEPLDKSLNRINGTISFVFL